MHVDDVEKCYEEGRVNTSGAREGLTCDCCASAASS
jgi:hypothetical protein